MSSLLSERRLLLTFKKPVLTRDKGLLRICSELTEQFEVVTSRDVMNDTTPQSILSLVNKGIATKKPGEEKEQEQKMLVLALPITYLSEWRETANKAVFNNSIVRGFPKLHCISHKGNMTKLINNHYRKRSVIAKRSNDSNNNNNNNNNNKLLTTSTNEGCNYYPLTFVVPEDVELLKNYVSQKSGKNQCLWIVKPQGSARGSGIRILSSQHIVNHINALRQTCVCLYQSAPNHKCIVQQYIDKPLLIAQHKFDLRIYVMIASVEPLQVYVHQQGLVRFATVPYNADQVNLKDMCQHLTNFSINKKNPCFFIKFRLVLFCVCDYILYYHYTTYPLKKKKRNKKKSDEESSDLLSISEEDKKYDEKTNQLRSHKWSLDDFWSFLLKCHSVTREHIWSQVKLIIADLFTIGQPKLKEGYLIAFGPNVSNNKGRCFDLLGIDILVDSDYKCWLMEFNRYCSLKCGADVDKHVKYKVISDMMKMLEKKLIQPLDALHKSTFPVLLDHVGTGWEKVIPE
ncbi:tubulin-tyrosine ligase [Reticulomyxa filosa]|uniref:Tubulin-tyrosine ligase n=1 Tax=Reticulomyxa filosa TaxID=46433 RepID=X6MXN6_RETFI|nr:tubulin-tyrosine ligase [Reticulomyxa filosa]|eukprot:ETO18361.1 tubulin-tyrosine ligase [Reticulomyxa filosa]